MLSNSRIPAVWWLAAFLISGCMALQAYATERAGLRLGSLSGPGWRARGIGLRLDWGDGAQLGFRLSIRELELAGLKKPLRDILVECAQGRLDPVSLACEAARVRADGSLLDDPRFTLAFKWDFLDRRLSLELSDMRIASGSLQASFAGDTAGWELDVRGDALELGRVQGLAAPYAPAVKGWEISGRLSPRVKIRATAKGVVGYDWHIRYQGVDFSDPQADYQAEQLEGRTSGRVRYGRGVWDGESSLQLIGGAILTPWFYLSPEGQVLEVQGRFGLDAGSDTLEVKSLRYLHPGVLEARISAILHPSRQSPLQQLSVRTSEIDLHALYAGYLQPVLGEGLLENLAWGGRAELSLDYGTGGPGRLVLGLHDVDVDGIDGSSQPRPFGLHGVDGRLVWTGGAKSEPSTLRWRRGHILEKITLGPAHIDLELRGDRLDLLREAKISVLDGQLLVDRFFMSAAPGEAGGLEFEGVLTPISLQRISRALGWPELAGKLSGVIPGVSYRDGRLQVAGTLLVRVFGGAILIRHLRIQDLFGVFPVLNADLELKDLDLEALTGTFAFGKITGKLGGRIEGLRLEDWKPVAFDARFATPKGDDSRHRISQKAVDNISNLGGAGVPGAVSRGLLRFFEDFGYNRLGMSCHLEKGVCEMGGVAPAENGYYLVEGGGIPRISIIGHNRRADWNVLLDQLRAISAASLSSPRRSLP